jgi:hypothetical protein
MLVSEAAMICVSADGSIPGKPKNFQLYFSKSISSGIAFFTFVAITRIFPFLRQRNLK